MQLIKHTQRKRYEFICSFGEHFPAKKARFRWDPKVKRWWTDDIDKASKLSEYADAEILAELEAINAERAEALQASRATDADIEIPCPEGLAYMPFQRAGIAYGLKRDGVLIADQMGLGKTIQALGIVNATPEAKTVLVICPASLRLNWEKEAERWLTREFAIQVIHAKNPPRHTANFVIINYDILKKHKKYLDSQEWDILIVDEAHFLKNPRAQRTLMTLGGRKATEPNPIPAQKKIFLTGTPIVNRPIEIQPVLAAIAPKEFGNFFAFARRYAGAYESQWGWDFSGATNLDELQERLRRTCMVRRLKKDVLTELPAKRRAVIEIPANGKSRVINAERKAQAAGEQRLAELKAALELAKASDNPDDYDNAVVKLREGARAHFEEIAELRKRTAIAKAPLVAAHVAEAVEQGNKVVVFAHHHEVIDLLVSELVECGVVKLDGRDSMEARNATVEAFQNDPDVKVFVGGIHAAGVGLTLTSSSHVVFCELDWVPGNICQAEDRCHRIGQVDQVLVQHIVLEGSIDARLAKTLVEKQRVIDKALDKEITEEPIVPTTDEKPPISARRTALAKTAETLTPEDIAKIHADLKTLSAFCDGAVAEDNAGFNRIDSVIGKSLAATEKLTSKQAALGKKITRKYHRQLGE